MIRKPKVRDPPDYLPVRPNLKEEMNTSSVTKITSEDRRSFDIRLNRNIRSTNTYLHLLYLRRVCRYLFIYFFNNFVIWHIGTAAPWRSVQVLPAAREGSNAVNKHLRFQWSNIYNVNICGLSQRTRRSLITFVASLIKFMLKEILDFMEIKGLDRGCSCATVLQVSVLPEVLSFLSWICRFSTSSTGTLTSANMADREKLWNVLLNVTPVKTWSD